ncbi:MAG: ParB N-terminal domain-containing protein, partial [Planctomycetes bacterium]|nr:ParB N-terminal domain-containing protein [Planctomycetota bacterium]MBL8696384.1 ParB N-terminal domain-containing protein [Planctomycetota bacterium]
MAPATRKPLTPTPQTHLEIRRVPLATLVPDPANVRTHDERNISAIRASLQRFGQVEPLLVHRSTRRIVAGHGRLQAMLELGWVEAQIVEVDFEPTEATALAIALNRTGELAGWDEPALAKILATLRA